MPQQTQTKVNGNRFSFTSISVEAANREQPKGVFKSINYSATQDPGVMFGNAVEIQGLTTGTAQGSGDFEMLVAEMDDFFDVISNNGQIPVMNADFNILVAYSVNNVDTRIDTLIGCRITEIGSSNQQGNDATTKTCKLLIRKMRQNGRDLFADPAA